MKSTDRAWEKWGKEQPYFGVLASDKFLSQNMTEDARQRFFESGVRHVEHVLAVIKARLDPDFEPQTVLDFGCGVGRLVVAFASVCPAVTGIDVSPSMLSEARKNCQAANLDNVAFFRSDDTLSELEQDFDLVHSHLVFQHIPTSRGMHLCEQLVSHIVPGGVLVLHLHYQCTAPRWIRALVKLRYRFPPLNMLRNLIKRVPYNQPAMQMNIYDLGSLIALLENNGLRQLYLEPASEGDFNFVTIYARKL